MGKIKKYEELPTDDDGQKYVILSDCCLATVIFKSIPTLTHPELHLLDRRFSCSKCDNSIGNEQIKVFTELKKQK